ncbi:MAG: hypothetical protein AMXMBFR47_39220 [Planctomycetota bacterium]
MKSLSKTPQYERFGETIRYLTVEELQQFFDAVEDYRHKLMMRVIYELGCRVGEFVRIQLRHIAFDRSTVYFPAENTKTRQRRVTQDGTYRDDRGDPMRNQPPCRVFT